MGRLFIILGILLVIFSVCGGVFMFAAVPLSGVMNLALSSEEREAELCESGEELVEETGSSTYTQGQGWGRPVQMYCVDTEGTRRNVTGEFGQGLMGQVGNLFTGAINNTMVFTVMTFGGILLIILGTMIRRRSQPQVTTMNWTGALPATPVYTSTVVTRDGQTVMTSDGQPANLSPDMERLIQQATQMAQGLGGMNFTSGEGNLTEKLRQLDEARKNGLISQTEYDRLRQQILDSMG